MIDSYFLPGTPRNRPIARFRRTLHVALEQAADGDCFSDVFI